jgi:chromosome segregation ATPase
MSREEILIKQNQDMELEIDDLRDKVQKLQQELDAARAKLADAAIVAGKWGAKLADAKAQIADYESALEFYSKESRLPQNTCMVSPVTEIYIRRQLVLAQDNGKLAKEALNKWSGK